MSAAYTAHDKFPPPPLFKHEKRTELIGLTQIDEVQVLPRLSVFNFTDTRLQEENRDNIKKMKESLEASSSLENFEESYRKSS